MVDEFHLFLKIYAPDVSTLLQRAAVRTFGDFWAPRVNMLRPVSPLQIACILVLIVLLVLHIAIGSAWELLVVMVAISSVGIWSLQSRRLTFGRVYICMLSAYSGLCALAVKAWLWQPLESNLIEPEQTALLLAVGFTSALVALIGSEYAAPAQPLVAYDGSDRLVLPLTLVGFLFQGLHIALRPQISGDSLDQTEGFGGFGSLYFVLLLGVALQFYWYEKTHNRRYLELILLTGVALVLMSVLGNVKRLFLDYCFIAALSVAAFQIKFRWAKLLSAGAIVGIALAYLSPAIHLTRDNIQGSGQVNRMMGVYEVLAENNFSLSKLSEAEDLYFQKFLYSYRPAASYVFPSTMNVDRFCLVLPLDQVVRSFESDRSIGLYPFVRLGLTAALPSVLVSKDAFTGADLVGWQYGIRDSGSIARPVIGLTASAFSAWGFWGVILLPLFVLLPAFFLLDRFPGMLSGNPVAVMMIALSVNLVEQGIDGVIVFLVRQAPLALLVSVLILRIGSRKAFQKQTLY